jgi:6-phosphogluconolactonase (cycloisomerase 2 family)
VAVTPDNRFLYVPSDSGTLDAYAVGVGGSLTPIALSGTAYAVGGGPLGIAVNQNNVYVAQKNGNGISIWSINQSSGALTPVACGPCRLGSGNPVNLVIDPTNSYVYVALLATHSIGVATIDPSTGAFSSFTIAYTGPSSFTPEDLVPSPMGNYLFATDGGFPGNVYAFPVTGATLGTPVLASTGGLDPVGIAIDPSGTFLFAANYATSNVAAFKITTSPLALTPVAGSPFASGGSGPQGVTVSPAGNFVYVSNQSSSSVTGFSYNTSTGILTQINTIATGSAPNFPLAHFVPVPTIYSISPMSGLVSTPVTINGSNFGATQGTSTVTFNGTSAGAALSWSNFNITVQVPIGATTGNLVVTVGGATSNPMAFAIANAPTISNVSPNSAPPTSLVTISGSNFGATQGTSTVTFNGTSAGAIVTWSNTIIRVAVPNGATTGNVVVTVDGVASGGSSPFTVTNSPIIANLSPGSGPVGTNVTIAGLNFGATQGTSTITFNGVPAVASAWSDTSISVAVPSGASTGSVIVTVGASSSAGTRFAVPPVLTSVSPAAGVAGTQVTISGSGFGSAQGAGTVWLGTTYATVVSWSDTQIVATIASNSRSGTAQVQQAGAWSGTVPFIVNTATISNVTPTSGLPGTQVTITGTGFGAQQGSGQVWLGTANGVVQSWSDTQVVALVAAGSASGNALVLQNGVTSNAVPFTVSTPQITSISPTSGPVGTSVTISGSGFGPIQGAGAVQLGSMNGGVVSWSDSQVVATVAAGSLSGIVSVTQNAVQSNSKSFLVTAPGGGSLTLTPVTLKMMVGDTHTIQALNSSNQPVAGLTWVSSDPTIVSLSTNDPPVLTAVAAGHVTITAGSASADVTVSSVPLAPGTVLWSNPINGASVDWILPAVPSPTGVADVFALSGSTVYAVTSDGTTAWTADVSDFDIADLELYPDFQGGLVAADAHKIVTLEGATGMRYPSYTAPDNCTIRGVGVHPDGTLFVPLDYCWPPSPYTSVIGIDPTTGTPKFQVPVPYNKGCGNPKDCASGWSYDLKIAGDGFAYVMYSALWDTDHTTPDPYYEEVRLALLRISSSGTSDDFTLGEWYYPKYYVSNCGPPYLPYSCYVGSTPAEYPTMITNADTGVLVAWYEKTGADWSLRVANVTGSGVSTTTGSQLPFSPDALQLNLQLDLQTQDGSFIGRMGLSGEYIFSMDSGGNLRWLLQNIMPYMATADGGFIGQQDSASPILTFDQYGNTTGQSTAQGEPGWLGNVLGYAYSASGGDLSNISSPTTAYATTFAALQGGNASHQGTAIQQVVTKMPQGPAKQLPNLSGPVVCDPLPTGVTPTCGNINAIELLTTASPDSIFQNFIQTFAPVSGNPSPSPIMTFTGPGNSNAIQVSGPGQVLTISLKGWPSWFRNPFSVMTERFDPVAHTISAVTLAGHPLAGWRYWRVYSIGPNDVVVETGAYDQPGPGPKNYWGYYGTRRVVSNGWKQYLQYIRVRLNAPQGSNLNGTLGGIKLRTYSWPDGPPLSGYWDYFGDFTQYILSNVCQSTSCN